MRERFVATFCDGDTPAPDPDSNSDSGEKKKHATNISDTPGKANSTSWVERALRAVEGAALVSCAVAAVQVRFSFALSFGGGASKLGFHFCIEPHCDREQADAASLDV